MKKYSIFSILCCLLLLVGCGKDKISYESGSLSDSSTSDYGYLVLPSVVRVDVSSEEFNQSQTKADDDSVEADDSYIVQITNMLADTLAYSSTYGELKLLEQLALRPSTYTIAVSSIDQIPSVGSVAHYYGTTNFTIVSDMETTIDDLTCTMSNIKVSVSFSADLLDLFQADSAANPEENLTVVVSIGGNSVDYTRADNGEINYFEAVEESNTLELSLSGMYNTAPEGQSPSYTMIEGWKQSITGVKAGQWRNISINVEHANEGTVDFTITIDTWTYDEQIDVDITNSSYQTGVGEAELDDPENYITDSGAPTVTQGEGGVGLDEFFYIDQTSFALNSSLQAICTKPLILNVTMSSGVTLSEAWIEFSTDNAAFEALLTSSLGEKRREYLSLAESGSDYYSFVDNSFVASYAAMYQLYIYEGTHRATIMTKDSEGRASYNYLTIVASNEGIEEPAQTPPTIEWRGGNSFDERYTVDPVDGLDVVIDITSQTGITGFTLEINSDTLTPDELSGINLAQSMDLINPGECEAGLDFLGFPTGAQVEGQTSMVFDITSFMPMLVAVGSGNSDFVLNVTDAGGTTSRTLQVKVE